MELNDGNKQLLNNQCLIIENLTILYIYTYIKQNECSFNPIITSHRKTHFPY